MPRHSKYGWNSVASMKVFAVAGFLLCANFSESKALTIPNTLSTSPRMVMQGQDAAHPSATSTPEKNWTGEITTAMCKKTGGSMGHDCILNCVKAGEKFVFIRNGQVHEIANQDFTDLTVHAGHRVKLTGHYGPDGKIITATKVEMARHP